MTILTQDEIDAMRGPGGYIDPREVEAAVIKKLSEGVSVEPVRYEFQWTNPVNSTDQPASMFVWAEVVPQWNGTMQQAVDNGYSELPVDKHVY
jgi:hypothetical protein